MFLEFIVIIIINVFIGSGFVVSDIKNVHEIDDSISNNGSLWNKIESSRNETKLWHHKVVSIRSSNLKANVFDKMLSNEMLSIKQQIHDKDLDTKSPVTISSKIIVPTPTLELKQRWPIEKLLSLSPKKYIDAEEENKYSKINMNKDFNVVARPQYIEDAKSNNDHVTSRYPGNLNNKLNKVVGVRSFSSNTKQCIHNHSITKQCFCMKSNPDTTCSLRCSALAQDTKICTHTENYSHCPICTRTTMLPYPFYSYLNHPHVFMGATDPTTYLYFPYTIKPQIYDNLEDDNEEEDDTDDEQIVSTNSKIDNTESNEKLDKENLINEVFYDLKENYGEIFIKDCFCRSDSSVITTYDNIIYVICTIILVTL